MHGGQIAIANVWLSQGSLLRGWF